MLDGTRKSLIIAAQTTEEVIMIKLPALFAVKDADGFVEQAKGLGLRSYLMAKEVIRVGTFRVESVAQPYFAAGHQYCYDSGIDYGLGTIGIREDELQFFEIVPE